VCAQPPSDGHLLELERYAYIVILPPRRFLEVPEKARQKDA
jgi:hypothetical protein